MLKPLSDLCNRLLRNAVMMAMHRKGLRWERKGTFPSTKGVFFYNSSVQKPGLVIAKKVLISGNVRTHRVLGIRDEVRRDRPKHGRIQSRYNMLMGQGVSALCQSYEVVLRSSVSRPNHNHMTFLVSSISLGFSLARLLPPCIWNS